MDLLPSAVHSQQEDDLTQPQSAARLNDGVGAEIHRTVMNAIDDAGLFIPVAFNPP